MRKAIALLGLMAGLALTACDDTTTAPRDITPPAAPRALYSVTGDGQVSLYWVENTESDLAGYRIYMAPCASGTSCPYDRVGSTTATQFVVSGLANGLTRYYAVSAVDRAGNESALSELDVFDTPRPQGVGVISNFVNNNANSGWDFSIAGTRSSGDPLTDMFYGYNGSVRQMFVPDFATNIQDAGYGTSLDAVDFAPSAGWSPTGSVELIIGHCYVVWTRDDRYAKFRVTSISDANVNFEWAYQTAAGNRELRARPAGNGAPEPRPVVWIR